jgi:hypothetical protein
MWEPETSTWVYKTIGCIASSFSIQFSPKFSKKYPTSFTEPLKPPTHDAAAEHSPASSDAAHTLVETTLK